MKFSGIILFFVSFFLPLFSFAENEKRSFYPGRSYFFWLLLGAAIYIFYRYQNFKDKKKFFQSPFHLSATLGIASLFISFLSINLFLKEPAVKTEIKKTVTIQLSDLIEQDKINYEEAEENYLDAQKHYKYVSDHFLIPRKWEENNTDQFRDDLTLQNFYYDRLSFSDSLYVNLAKYSLGLFYYHSDSIQKALGFWKQIPRCSFPYFNHYTASACLKLNDTANALHYLNNAIIVKDVFRDDSYTSLVQILKAQGNDHALIVLLDDSIGTKYIPPRLATQLYFKQGRIISYYRTVLNSAFRNFKLTGAFASFVILIVWIFFIVRLDVFEPEKINSIVFTLIAGMTFTFLVFYCYDFIEINWGYDLSGDYWNDFWYCILGIGCIEEFAKIIPLLFIITFLPKLVNEAYDYILFACIAALGFAFVENLMYLSGNLSGTMQIRAMASVPGHMIDSSIVAYGFVLSRFRYKYFPIYFSFPIFFFLGTVSHGLYDYWLFTGSNLLFLLHFLVSVSIWVIIINNCLNNSPHFSYKIKLGSGNLQTYMAVTFLGIYILEYILVAWEVGPSFANQKFNSTLAIGSIFIIYYTHKLTNMDLVKGYWNSISYRSIFNKRRDENFSFMVFLGRLIAGDIIPHSFVNSKILLGADQNNPDLSQYLTIELPAEILDRVVVTCKSKTSGESYQDPYWFVIKMKEAFSPGTINPEYIFLFRFITDRPSSEPVIIQEIYLYTFKDGVKESQIKRDDLRALGKAYIKLRE